MEVVGNLCENHANKPIAVSIGCDRAQLLATVLQSYDFRMFL